MLLIAAKFLDQVLGDWCYAVWNCGINITWTMMYCLIDRWSLESAVHTALNIFPLNVSNTKKWRRKKYQYQKTWKGQNLDFIPINTKMEQLDILIFPLWQEREGH